MKLIREKTKKILEEEAVQIQEELELSEKERKEVNNRLKKIEMTLPVAHRRQVREPRATP